MMRVCHSQSHNNKSGANRVYRWCFTRKLNILKWCLNCVSVVQNARNNQLTTEYFDRLLEQIREIRLSERRFYQKITDIYATALDYDRTAKTTKDFFC